MYVHGSEERLLQAAWGDGLDGLEATSVLKTKEVRSEQSWVWLPNGDLNRETESLIVAAQNQSIRTNLKQRLTKGRKTCYADYVRKLMKL